MVEYMARDGYYMAYACGTDLTDWINGKAAIVVAELNALDWFIGASVTHTKPRTVNVNPMTASHYPKRLQTGRQRGRISSRHFLQTGIFTYAVMGGCSTAGAGDPYTKTITKKATETPESFAFHFEKEGTTANRRKDCLGVVPRSLDINVSEADPIAKQTYNAEFAFTGAGGNLAQPTAFTQANLPPYTWYNYRNSSGATAFTYNTGAIDVDIVSVDMHVPPFRGSIDLGVRITDAGNTALDTIADLRAVASSEGAAEYAGDLDFIADFYVGANDYLKYTWDKMYINPESYEEVFQEEGDWFDGVRFTLEFLDENSSLAVEEKSLLSKIYYEND
jgi:hypothetical protein